MLNLYPVTHLIFLCIFHFNTQHLGPSSLDSCIEPALDTLLLIHSGSYWHSFGLIFSNHLRNLVCRLFWTVGNTKFGEVTKSGTTGSKCGKFAIFYVFCHTGLPFLLNSNVHKHLGPCSFLISRVVNIQDFSISYISFPNHILWTFVWLLVFLVDSLELFT